MIYLGTEFAEKWNGNDPFWIELRKRFPESQEVFGMVFALGAKTQQFKDQEKELADLKSQLKNQ